MGFRHALQEGAVVSTRDEQEFEPGETSAAEAFIRSLSAELRRVYVDEWDGREWRFVFGDDREHVAGGLGRITPGVRFRIRGS